jgi:hypothetical protein
MLLLNSARTITVDGVTVFPDHADPNQFWYLPGPVSLARRADGRPCFTFIKFKPAAVAGGAKGGGFVMFTTSLRLPPKTEQKILGRIGALAQGEPKLALAQFDQGSVKCVALNLEGSAGAVAAAAPAGAFNAVEKILGATIPSMQGDEEAAFSLALSQEGAIILEQAYQQGVAPIGVVYELKFTGLRPALKVKITADFKRVYDGLSASLSAQYYFVQAGIDVAFEKLKQAGVIKIEVIDFTGAPDRDEKEKWALDFFKQDILSKWFEPTLTPGESRVTTPSAAGIALPALPSLGGQPSATPAPSPAPTAAPGGTPAPAQPAASPAPTAAPAASAAPAPSATPAPPPPRAAAQLTVTARDPNPSPAGFEITHTPSATGTRETLRFTGGATPPQVKVDNGDFQTLDADRQLTLDVAPGATRTVIARWTNQTRRDAFNLYFSFDKPRELGFTTATTNPLYHAYLTGIVSDDPIYSRNHQAGSSAPTQVQAVRDWLQTVPPDASGHRVVDLEAHASWEGDDSKGAHNSNLSQRRLEVARGVLRQADAQLVVGNGGVFLGHQEARAAGRQSQPADNPDGSPNPDRVARMLGNVSGQAVSLTATIRRDAPPPTTPPPVPTTQPPVPTTHPPGPTTPPPTTNPPATTHPPATTAAPPGGQPAGNPAIAFRLKFVHQEELKTFTFEYNRQDATQRTYAPQGFFDLMLQDLAAQDKMFVEVDLDDPFFRTLSIDASMPIDFSRIGLKSSHVAIDYGDLADPRNHRSGDFIFSPQDPADKRFECFLNARFELAYRYAVDFNFDPQSTWTAEKFSYHFGPIPTDNRNLFVNPYERLGFLEVTLFPHEVDDKVVDSIDVFITPLKPDLTPAGPESTFHVLPDSPEQVYRFRSEDPQAVLYSYRATTLLKDGATRQSEPKTSRASRLAVNDPFDDALAIELVPLFDPTVTKLVFVDIEYDDAPNNYHRRERVTLEGQAPRSTLRLALMNKEQRQFRFRLTFIGVNNQIQAGAFQDTTETILAIAP